VHTPAVESRPATFPRDLLALMVVLPMGRATDPQTLQRIHWAACRDRPAGTFPGELLRSLLRLACIPRRSDCPATPSTLSSEGANITYGLSRLRGPPDLSSCIAPGSESRYRQPLPKPINQDAVEWHEQEGAAGMWRRTGIFETSLLCLLALLATVQPAIAVHCVCPCGQIEHSKSPVALASCDCDGYCLHSEEACTDCSNSAPCPSDSANEAHPTYSRLSLHPCSCPKDCDCHLRHSPPNGSKPSEGPQVAEPKINSSYSSMPGWSKPNVPLATRLNQPGFDIHRALGAPPSCALLCRFTI
jgi:hypothetical protein